MMNILVHAHSGLRWIILLLLLITIGNALVRWKQRKNYLDKDRRLALFTLIFSHIQLALGFVVYFLSSKVVFNEMTMSSKLIRYFTVEHPVFMILAIVLITIGYSRSKKKEEDTSKFRMQFWFYAIALLLILIGIPWPWQDYGAGWG
ncbi:MAG TPA: cytochrome B [Cytophagales bacterium]|jgi:uncharacterized protein YacL|nr:cytochrome B [Cytophagales bacterium]